MNVQAPGAARCPRCGSTPSAPGAARSCHRCLLAVGLLADEAWSDCEGAVQPPAQVAGYRVLDVLGCGGAGVVYLAEEPAPGRRKVALKILHPGAPAGEARARFEAERRTLARMSHPAIPRVLRRARSEDGRPCFAMEWVPGVPITEYCERERLAVSERLELFAQLCDAVQHVHERGYLHGDIKPSNVLVSREGGRPRASLIDFGVARAVPPGNGTTSSAVAPMGTAPYMSPEQWALDEGAVGVRSDVYSLGVVLYELLVGALPWESPPARLPGWGGVAGCAHRGLPAPPSARLCALGPIRAWEAAVRRRVRPRDLVERLRRDLDAVALQALEPRCARRYASAVDLAADVRRSLEGRPVRAASAALHHRFARAAARHPLALAAGAAVATALLLTAWRRGRRGYSQRSASMGSSRAARVAG